MDFSKSLLRLSTSQISKDAGFDAIESFASSVLLDVAERYLLLLGTKCAQMAQHAGRTEVSLEDLYLTLCHYPTNAQPTKLLEFWETWGLRLPTTKRETTRERVGGTGNAILEAILGIKKQKTVDQADKEKEISGFFRMEPGAFPLGMCTTDAHCIDVDEFYQKEYVPQEVPDSDVYKRILGNNDSQKENALTKARPFSESLYYRGDLSQYKEHIWSESRTTKVARDKSMSKTRKLFERAYLACLEQGDCFRVDASESMITLHTVEQSVSDRQRFNSFIPEVSNSGYAPGLMEDAYITSLPDLTGSKRAIPIYKDDKRAARREQKLRDAARAALGLPPENAPLPAPGQNGTTEPVSEIPSVDSGTPGPSQMLNDFSEMFSDPTPFSSQAPTAPIPAAVPMTVPMTMSMPTTSPLKMLSTLPVSIAPTIPVAIPAPAPVSSPAKLKFKITQSPPKAMAPAKPPPALAQPDPINLENYSGEQIHCICANPTTDYGLFMIACDKCALWYHGDCVGVGPTSIADGGFWHCFKCKLTR